MDMKTSAATEIGQLIDERPLSALQIRIIVFCGFLVFLDGYDIQTMALTVASVGAEWNIPPSSFGLPLAAALIGIGIGAAFLAPLGDTWGRRPLLITSMALVGIASIATTLSTELWHLVLWRLLTGAGLGASLPNATALTSEYVPASRRAGLVTLMYCNVALGAFVAGFTASPIIEAFGWRAIFIVGGVIPLALSVLIALGVPESVRFLVGRRPGDPRIAAVVKQIAPDAETRALYSADHQVPERKPVIALVTPPYRARTVLLWSVYCLNGFALYLLISWLPTILLDAGWVQADALRGGVMIQAGGIVSGLLLSWYVDRGRTVVAMVAAYAVSALALALFLVIPSTSWSWWLLLLVIGAGTSGTQFALNALTAILYPPVIRATGVGWGLSVGRIGAILGPLVGGWVIAQFALEPVEILGLLVLPVSMCAASVLLLPRVLRERG